MCTGARSKKEAAALGLRLQCDNCSGEAAEPAGLFRQCSGAGSVITYFLLLRQPMSVVVVAYTCRTAVEDI